MGTYVIFNKKTGDIIHTHTEAALDGEPLPVSKEDLIAMHRPRPGEKMSTSDMDVLEVDLDLLRRGQSNRQDIVVDVQKRVLTERPKPSSGVAEEKAPKKGS